MSVISQPKLSWEQVVEQFKDLIKFAAKQEVQNNPSDTMISVEDLYQEGMMKLYDCWVIWCVGKNKDMDEFGPIFRKSLFRAVKRKRGTQYNHIDLQDAVNVITDGTTPEDTIEEMYRNHGISHLREMLSSDVAKRLLDELLEPSERAVWEAWADKARKEMLKSLGKKVNVPKDTRVKVKHIMRAMGISTKQYDMAMLEIREKASFLREEL